MIPTNILELIHRIIPTRNWFEKMWQWQTQYTQIESNQALDSIMAELLPAAPHEKPEKEYHRNIITSFKDKSTISHDETKTIFAQQGMDTISECHTTVDLTVDPKTKSIQSTIRAIQVKTPSDNSSYLCHQHDQKIAETIHRFSSAKCRLTLADISSQMPSPKTSPSAHFDNPQDDRFICTQINVNAASTQTDTQRTEDFWDWISWTSEATPSNRSETDYDTWLNKIYQHDDSDDADILKNYMKQHYAQTPHNSFNFNLVSSVQSDQQIQPLKTLSQTTVNHNQTNTTTTLTISTYVLSETCMYDVESSDGMPESKISIRWQDHSGHLNTFDINDTENQTNLENRIKTITATWLQTHLSHQQNLDDRHSASIDLALTSSMTAPTI